MAGVTRQDDQPRLWRSRDQDIGVSGGALPAALRATIWSIDRDAWETAGGVTVGGKKLRLELVMLDDESDPTKTVARLETLATQGVVAYLGGAGSDLHGAAEVDLRCGGGAVRRRGT